MNEENIFKYYKEFYKDDKTFIGYKIINQTMYIIEYIQNNVRSMNIDLKELVSINSGTSAVIFSLLRDGTKTHYIKTPTKEIAKDFIIEINQALMEHNINNNNIRSL